MESNIEQGMEFRNLFMTYMSQTEHAENKDYSLEELVNGDTFGFTALLIQAYKSSDEVRRVVAELTGDDPTVKDLLVQYAIKLEEVTEAWKAGENLLNGD